MRSLNGYQIRYFSNITPRITANEFSTRRHDLINLGKSEFKGNSSVAAIVKGSTRQSYAPHVYYPFKQSSYFRYLSGVVVPDSYLYIDDKKSTLFIQEVDDYSKLWDGYRYTNDDLKKISGIDEILDIKEFELFISKNIYNKNLLIEAEDFKTSPLIEIIMKRPQNKLINFVDQLRWIKTLNEIELMKKTCEIGSESINLMIRESKHVLNEAVIVGRLEFEYKRRGASGSAYPPVVAAGDRANTIHYIDSDQSIKPGQCVLVDAGCDLEGYISDISRNFPISGKFTNPQKILYDALYAVHLSCLEYVKHRRPLKLNDLYFYMLRMMAKYFVEAGIFETQVCEEDAYAICDDLCPHHISHYLGMDVHDTFSIPRNIELKPGVIITVEPGIYIRPTIEKVRPEFKGIGFRIEDDVLITKTGAEILTEKCVKNSNEIENLMNGH